MKSLLWVIVTALLLVAVVTGCDGMWRYDVRLVAADSLMHDHPDSALALVQAIEPGSLTRERDRAYRDLLLTQGRYRSYVTATSDSDINRALDYYRRHEGEREKLTRAYIYKGAVMEELGLPDTAMTYYKYAEATAAPDDYFNLGYTKMRIATLYQDQLSQDTAAIIRLKSAISYFSLIRDYNYLISCYGQLGAICGVRYPDSTEFYLKTAIRLAQKYNPSKQYTYKSKLSGFNLYYKKDYRKAILLSMDVLRNGKSFCDENQFYYYAVWSFIKLGLIDSAKYIFSITPAPSDRVDSMNYCDVLAELNRYDSNQQQYAINAIQSHQYINRIISDSKEKDLLCTEVKYEKEQFANHYLTLIKHNDYLILFIVIVLVFLFLVSFLARKFHDNLIKKQNEYEIMKKELKTAIIELQKQNHNTDNNISKYVNYRISAINELYQSIRIRRKDDDLRRKTVVPLSSFLKELNENKELLKINLSDSFWNKLKISVNGEFNNIVSFIERQYPNLSDADIKLFMLLCAKISPQLIQHCMNYTNSKTASTYRNRLIRTKMGLDMTFDEFIDNYMKGAIN